MQTDPEDRKPHVPEYQVPQAVPESEALAIETSQRAKYEETMPGETMPGDTMSESKTLDPEILQNDAAAVRTVDGEIVWNQVDGRWVAAERFSGVIFVCILAIALVVTNILLLVFVYYGQPLIAGLVGASSLLVIAMIAYLLWYAPQWSYEAKRWRETHGGLEIKRGIWWRHSIFIPRERIQHTDVVCGPVSRKFGLAVLVINTAGTHNHQIMLEGLEFQTAQRLRHSLLPQDEYER